MKNFLHVTFVSLMLIFTSLAAHAQKPTFYSTECYDYNGAAVIAQPNFNIETPAYAYQDEYGNNYIEYNLNIMSLFTTPARTFLFFQSCGKVAIADRFVSNIEASCWAIKHMVEQSMIPFNYIYYIDEELMQRESLYRLNLGVFELADCFN
jgi:hypothetical protein